MAVIDRLNVNLTPAFLKDGVFDISEYNNGAVYTDLSDALGRNGVNIPPTIRKGGMSVKFIMNNSNYGNKYVSYRLMATSFITTPSDWQGISFDGNDFTYPNDEQKVKLPTVSSILNGAGTQGIIKGNVKFVRSGVVYDNCVIKSTDENNVFSVCDGRGNIIAILNGGIKVNSDGTIETSSFNSANTITSGDAEEIAENVIKEEKKENLVVRHIDESNAFSVCDRRGNIIIKVNAGLDVGSYIQIDNIGRIKTETFDSDKVKKVGLSFPTLNTEKEEFRWLDIGNSHSLCALRYLRPIAVSQEVDLSKVAFCRVTRGGSSFKSWVKAWNDEDTSGEGDQLTGSRYYVTKEFGELSVKVTGNTYATPSSTAVPVVDAEVTSGETRFWGGDCSILRSLLKDNKFDLITIHQRYLHTTSNDYNNSDGWKDHSDAGYFNEFIRIIKTYQPQACVGVLFSLVPFQFAGSTLNGINDMHNEFSNVLKRFMTNNGIDLVIPCDTALSNLRNSSVPNEIMEGFGIDGDIIARNGFNYDTAHTPFGVTAYTMSCVAWEMVFARMYGKSCYGNTYREKTNNDGQYNIDANTVGKLLKGSYIRSSDNVRVLISGGHEYIGCTSTDGGTTWDYANNSKATIRVSDDNAEMCQKAAILAVNDIWKIIDPTNINLFDY